MKSLFITSFQIMYKSQFQKTDPYDWFCARTYGIFEFFIYIFKVQKLKGV